MTQRDAKSTHVVVLAGGPDAEREVSVMSASAIAEGLRESDRFGKATYLEIDRLTVDDLARIEGDVFFPALHGRWGEGGPLQELLEKDGRPYVGCGPDAARAAMDKIESKRIAERLGIPIAPMYELADPDQPRALNLPLVVKPIDDGSSVNVFICRTGAQFENAMDCVRRQWAAENPAERQRYMVEQFIPGRELTIGVVGDEVSSVIEIVPNVEFYDYEAKYTRDDTRYVVDPAIPDTLRDAICESSLWLFKAMGCRDLARVDFRFDEGAAAGANDPREACCFLEINTMPGFTSHSLVPMGAKAKQGWPMSELCARLVEMALARRAATQSAG